MTEAREKKLQAFVSAMRGQFTANDGRGGWRSQDLEDQAMYFREMQNTMNKLADLIAGGASTTELSLLECRAEILAQAADIANIALILADNAGAIKEGAV